MTEFNHKWYTIDGAGPRMTNIQEPNIQGVVIRGSLSAEHLGQLEDMDREIETLKKTVALLCSFVSEKQQIKVASLYDFTPQATLDGKHEK